jgi:hypothetical protein
MQNISAFPDHLRLNSVSQTNQFLPPKSIATCAKQSSIGKQNRNAQYLICYPVLWQKLHLKQSRYLRWYDAHLLLNLLN